jgi:hypothetical protein
MNSNAEQNMPIIKGHDFMLEVLKSFFSRARNVTGSEETYRALLVYQLRQAGIEFEDIVAEYRAVSGRIDLAILDRSKGGEVIISDLIEIKGGAYGNRHALHDELKPGLESRDLRKLEETGDSNTRRWFIALDLSSIRGPVSDEARSWVTHECASRNIGFAYYDFSTLEAEVVSASGKINMPIEDQTPSYRMNHELTKILDSDLFWAKVRKGWDSQRLHEQNQVLRIYEALMLHSIPDYAISLETQFQFAKGNTKNGNNRPDICVFDPTINGKFNLYAQGKSTQSRDALKLSKLQRLIEVKVSPSLSDALDDINKLAKWRSQMKSKAQSLGVEIPGGACFMFVAANVDDEIVPEIMETAKDMNISVKIL